MIAREYEITWPGCPDGTPDSEVNGNGDVCSEEQDKQFLLWRSLI